MPVLRVGQRLCLSDLAVPVEAKSLPLVDPYNLVTLDDSLDDDMAVSMVQGTARGSLAWLQQNLGAGFEMMAAPARTSSPGPGDPAKTR